MTDRERAYNAKLEELIARVGRLEDSEVRRILDLLEQARRDIAAMLAQTDWQAYRLPQLREAVERTITAFSRQYGIESDRYLSNAWNAGIDLIDWPLHHAGFRLMVPEVSRTALEIMQGYSADLVSRLSADAIARINGEITMGILGQRSPWQIMKAIGRSLDDPGVFGSIAVRAETITRTEMARVHSAAREARIRDVVDANPEIPWQKKWLSSGKAKPRPHHAALHGRIVPIDRNFPGNIPYPHAPGLPASETVNCGCVHVLTRSDWESLPADWEESLYNARAIYD